MKTRLCSLGDKYKTDKVVSGYTTLYDSLFCYRDCKRVMEIGIGTPEAMTHVPGYIVGASLYMWRDYFPSAQIYGLDINPDVLINEGRIRSLRCDQRNPQSLKAVTDEIGGDFDLIVDDGDHTAQSALTAFQVFSPFVRPGGIYIIEDTEDQTTISDALHEMSCPHVVVNIRTQTHVGKAILIYR